MRKLNLGCGRDIRPASEGWINMDIARLEGVDVVHDFMQVPWPFRDGEFSHVYCSHVLEHVPHYIGHPKDGLVVVLEEMHRVMQADGTVEIRVPHYRGDDRWVDPTHTRVVHPGNFRYFEPGNSRFGYYSTARFHVESVKTTKWAYWGRNFIPLGKSRLGIVNHLAMRVPLLGFLLRSQPLELLIRLRRAS